ncbi:MAG: hypothetical protein LUE22_06070, partial [Oscillospiraceae bacterium]|nr:hypothetical protein [Oscillospiraceae bacterium]
ITMDFLFQVSIFIMQSTVFIKCICIAQKNIVPSHSVNCNQKPIVREEIPLKSLAAYGILKYHAMAGGTWREAVWTIFTR